MTGPLADAAGLGAVRADLASVVQQVLGPARVWLRISHCDRDWLTRDRRWHERSQADRGFDRQPTQGRMFSQLASGTGGVRDPPARPSESTNRQGSPFCYFGGGAAGVALAGT
jgi:hypothetical protein